MPNFDPEIKYMQKRTKNERVLTTFFGSLILFLEIKICGKFYQKFKITNQNDLRQELQP